MSIRMNCYSNALLLCFVMYGVNSQQFAIPLTQTSSCLTTITQYFDFGILLCRTCGTLMVPDSTGYDCECKPGYRADINNVRILTCSPCVNGTTPDGYYCLDCAGGTLTDNQCTCADSQQLSLVSLSLTDNTTFSSTCSNCSSPLTNSGNQQCAVCPECCLTGSVVDGLCFNESTTTILQALSLPTTEPQYIIDNVRGAYGACIAQPSMRNQTACQHLANMCVMEQYLQAAIPCNLYSAVNGVRGTDFTIADGAAWQDKEIPWLYYEQNTNNIRFDTGITTSFAFDAGSKLDLFVAQYRANGTFLGISTVENGLIQLCKDKPSVMNAAYVFGTSFLSSCSLDSKSLFNDVDNANTYYDMFLQFTSSTGEVMLYPIPVLVNNYVDGRGDSVNSGSITDDSQFVRRFFLIDNIYSADARYASSMELLIRLQASGGTGAIYPPILRMSYSTVSADVLSDPANPTVDASFTVSYSSDVSEQNEGIKISMSIFGVLAFLYAAVETSGWRRRQGLPYVEITSLIQFMLFFMGNLANVFLIVMLGYTTVLLIFFKGQNSANSYTPPNDSYQDYLLIVFTSVAFACKFVAVLVMIFQQSSIDIFLMDWERPRAKGGEDEKISAWRTFFIANEWNEIQTCRKINTTFQLFASLLFLEVIGFKNLALLDSTSTLNPPDGEYDPPSSRLLRFAVGGLVYVVIALVQVIYFKLIHENFFNNKIVYFLDLCSVSNISIFILSLRNFGYYIHGRSVHGRADTDMAEMRRLMQREQSGPVPERGLSPGKDDQVFEIVVPTKLRQHYDKVYQPLQLVKSQPAARGGNTAEDSLNNESMKAYNLMRLFLTSFIDHSVRDMDYEIRDKLFLEKLLSMEFQETTEVSVFTSGDDYRFADVLFYGNEVALLVLDVLLFLIIDYGATDFVLSAIITYIVGRIFKTLRDVLGKYNLERKTLIDKRFLI